MSDTKVIETGPLHCPDCVSEEVAQVAAGSWLRCGNCGARFDKDAALVRLGEVRSAD
jgi:ribosomal protein L37AE/L43A